MEQPKDGNTIYYRMAEDPEDRAPAVRVRRLEGRLAEVMPCKGTRHQGCPFANLRQCVVLRTDVKDVILEIMAVAGGSAHEILRARVPDVIINMV